MIALFSLQVMLELLKMPLKPQRVLNCTAVARPSPSTERDWASLGKQALVYNDDLAQDKQRKPTCHSQHSRPLRYLQISRNIPYLLVCFLLHSGPTSRGSSVYTKTPMYGSQTPMYGSRTPMYGSQTPTHGDGKVDLKERISLSKLCFVLVLICMFCGPHRKPHSSLWLNDTIPWSFTHSISRWSLGSNTTKYSRAKWRLRLQFWYFHSLPRGKFFLTVFSSYKGGYVSRLSGVLIFPPWKKKNF